MRPETTLFMLMSVDGKISTGDTDALDVDKDFPNITEVAEGLEQYYRLEQETDAFSLISGRVMAKIGSNHGLPASENPYCTMIVIDNKPHLEASGVACLLRRFKGVILVTDNHRHPAFEMANRETLTVLFYENGIEFTDLFSKLKNDYGVNKLTVQSGGTLNTQFVRQGLIDHISIVIAPALIGGTNTPTLMDGESLHNLADLHKVRALKLKACNKLDHSYLNLQYDVIN
ncbi:MAG: dihydrofolate reductase family protein [Alphaproteobacteria bacterium]|nr:dihydrofolate reductase family protein [Alphaproteobacteria bacterium]